MKKIIQEKINERQRLIDDENETNQIDILANEIYDLLVIHKDELPVDFIIESLTKLGNAPSILYDDDGSFAISEDGFQSLTSDTDDTQTMICFVKKKQWKSTIREAINYYFENFKND
jgi:hypothetical protein